LKAALAYISRLRKAIECSRPIDDSSAAPHNKHVAAFDNMINDMPLRDYFAAKAMHAIITEPIYEGAQSFFMYFKKRLGLKGEGMDAYAQVAYAMADAMLKAREVSNG
jgi:hypothetical protein